MIDMVEWLLPLIFFVVAFLYSSVGMGGGSSYTAILLLTSISTMIIPMISLVLNLFVTTISSFNFIRAGHAKLRIILPFVISAIPMAYIGGAIHVEKIVFMWILLVSLILVAIRIYILDIKCIKSDLTQKAKTIISVISGSILGLLAGIVGIGGGIYLVPLIIMLNLGTVKQAAATASVFIWMVSASGLLSRFQYNAVNIENYYYLVLAVIVGSIFGSYAGSFKCKPKTMERALGSIIIIAIVFIIKKIIEN